MGVYSGPMLVILPGLLAVIWSIFAVRRATAARRWTLVEGLIVQHERGARTREVVDVVEYPLPEGGRRSLRPEPHGQYPSGRPVGTAVPVWRDPVDALNAVLELPALERFAGPLLVGILGGFFFGGGIVWAGLIFALVNR